MVEDRNRETAASSPYFRAASMPATGAWAAKRRLARIMREVIEKLVTAEAPEEVLARAADDLESFSRRLGDLPKRTRLQSFAESAMSGNVDAVFDQSPLIGLSNPMAPPIRLSAVDGGVRGHGAFGSAYEGPPGHVHGGFIAAAFDEVLGYAQSTTGNPGMTGTLIVRYRRPTPLNEPLEFHARVDRIDGRKIHASGTLTAEGGVTAEAEGIFVSVDAGRFREMMERDETAPGRDESE